MNEFQLLLKDPQFLFAIGAAAFFLWVVLYVTARVRAWKVQEAILEMQKDLREIKEKNGSSRSDA